MVNNKLQTTVRQNKDVSPGLKGDPQKPQRENKEDKTLHRYYTPLYLEKKTLRP